MSHGLIVVLCSEGRTHHGGLSKVIRGAPLRTRPITLRDVRVGGHFRQYNLPAARNRKMRGCMTRRFVLHADQSKAALNQFMRSYAARHSGTSRAMVLMAPGWVRTEMGGPDAHLSIDESVPNLVNVLLKKQGNAGLEYLDYSGRTVPW